MAFKGHFNIELIYKYHFDVLLVPFVSDIKPTDNIPKATERINYTYVVYYFDVPGKFRMDKTIRSSGM